MADLVPENETQFDSARITAGDRIDPNSGLASGERRADAAPEETASLFPAEECRSLGDEWQNIQASFVDEPRASVQKADALVKRTVGILETSFAEMHNSLEGNWEKDKDVSTEDLRVALRNYRSFFQRLLSV